MRIHKLVLPLFATAALGLTSVAICACQAEGQAKFGGQTPPAPPPPPPPAPPPPATVEAPPPPPPPEPPKKVVSLKGVQMKSATQIDMPGDIEFQKASAKIVMNDKSKKVLTQLVQIMKDNPEITRLSIEGNTDNEGETKGFDNVKLSHLRAQAVIDFLTKNGVDTKRLTPVGNGSKNPLAPNDTPDHMAENRRVEFHVREFNGQAVATEGGSSGSAAASTSTASPASSAAAMPKKDMDKDKPKAK
jgi:outer membrane protein OmpA-like peptidoglycan-associated protein